MHRVALLARILRQYRYGSACNPSDPCRKRARRHADTPQALTLTASAQNTGIPHHQLKGRCFISNRQRRGKKARNVRRGMVGLQPRTLGYQAKRGANCARLRVQQLPLSGRGEALAGRAKLEQGAVCICHGSSVAGQGRRGRRTRSAGRARPDPSPTPQAATRVCFLREAREHVCALHHSF